MLLAGCGQGGCVRHSRVIADKHDGPVRHSQVVVESEGMETVLAASVAGHKAGNCADAHSQIIVENRAQPDGQWVATTA